MKIHSLKIKNFRGYTGETTVLFENLTAFVGKNDIGKSSILEALDIFFNDGKGAVKIEKDDVNVTARANEDKEIRISLCFVELPERIVIDATNETTLQSEYLLNEDGRLEVVKVYSNAGAAKVFIRPCTLQTQNAVTYYKREIAICVIRLKQIILIAMIEHEMLLCVLQFGPIMLIISN